MNNRFILMISVLFLWCLNLYAQGLTFHGKIRNSFYAYESDQKHSRMYQFMQFSTATPNKMIGLNASWRTLTDSKQKIDTDLRFRAYILNLEFKKLFNDRVNIILGRQFLYPGISLGALDGLNISAALGALWRLQLYAGGESAPLRTFEAVNLRDRFVVGGLAERHRFYATDIQLLYLHKSDKGAIYWQLAGLNVNSRYFGHTQVRLQIHYNIKSSDLHRVLFNVRRDWSEKLATQFEYKIQKPRIYANSYFTIFESAPYQQIRAATSWQVAHNYFVDGQYQLLLTEGTTANRLLLGIHDRRGSINLIYENGDMGDQLGLSADYAYEVVKNLIASVYIDYSRYRTETVYEFEQQLANAARLSYRLREHWFIDVEYQWLTNRITKSDSRLLNHLTLRW